MSSNQASDGQGPSKRPKIDLSHELKKNALESITVSNCEQIFQQAINFREIECWFAQRFCEVEKYRLLQGRLLTAQIPRFPELLTILKEAKCPKAKITRRIGHVLQNIIESRLVKDSEVLDALKYRQAICLNITAFSQWPKELLLGLKDAAGNTDPVEYYESLVEASERHLKAYPTLTTTFVPPVVKPLTTINAPAPPSNDSQPLPGNAENDKTTSSTEPYSDEYLSAKVTNFIVKKEHLAQAIPWDKIDDCGSGLKKDLERAYRLVTVPHEEFRTMPDGVLLHGDQGTGKTSFVESFAAHKDLVMFKVDGTVHGSLKGQSEKLIRYIFDAVRETASQKPCVLMFDEVDGLLGAAKVENSAFQSMIKQLWGEMINKELPCFIFGTTNHPWNIDMNDYGRRFALKVHITLPNDEGRRLIIQHSLSKFWTLLDDRSAKEMTRATKGFSANDIKSGIKKLAGILVENMFEAKRWTMIDKDGIGCWVPAEEGEDFVEDKYEDMVHTYPRPFTSDIIAAYFESGMAVKTGSESAEKKHRLWNVQHRSR